MDHDESYEESLQGTLELDSSGVDDEVEIEELVRDPCHPAEGFVAGSRRNPAPPLAGIVEKELEHTDPRRFFPDYKQDGILRFSRLFATNPKPSNNNHIWWTSRTFNKNATLTSDDKRSSGDRDADANTPDGWALKLGSTPRAEECVEDENDILCRPTSRSREKSGDVDEEEIAPWRNGPAKIWYDRLGLGQNPANFDYGFKLAKNSQQAAASTEDDSLLLPVALERWEENIIIDDEDARRRAAEDFAKMKYPRCGWIPTQQTRSYQSFVNAWHNGSFQAMFSTSQDPSKVINVETADPTLSLIDASHSMFPSENLELENYRWEDDVIIDTEQMPRIPRPKILTLDAEDDPSILGIPEDKADDRMNESGTKGVERKGQPKKANLVLSQVHSRQQLEAEERMETTVAQSEGKDPFNLSNDEYYFPQITARTAQVTSRTLQHSIPAQNLHRQFFPTDLDTNNVARLRAYHRAAIKRKNFRQFISKWEVVYSLTRHMKKSEERKDRERASESGGDVVQIREVQELSGRDGFLLLLEYMEENPPLLSQPGMASRILQYKKAKSMATEEPEFGEIAYVHASSPFLGMIANEESLPAIENNLYRSAIFRHSARVTDFLLIRTKLGLFIRHLPPLFLAGQELPQMLVPSPSSKQAAAFSRDFLMAYIYRLFWESEETPRRVKFQEIRRAFPHLTETALKKRLKGCADFKKIGAGAEQVYWVLRSDFRLPSKEEVHSMISPEMYCAHWSMLSAAQRLRDAGYGDKYIFAPENDDSDTEEAVTENEVRCAPWNTTKAYQAALRGKCLLDQTGIADPTGCSLGFSYVKVPLRQQKEKENFQVPKRLVTGTNADLRKLPLKEAREMCREWGFSDEEMNPLSRWELIHVIRTLSTQAARENSDFSGVGRFARGNLRLGASEALEKHKVFCQQKFEQQNRALSIAEEKGVDEDGEQETPAPDIRPSSPTSNLRCSISTLNEELKKTLTFDQDQFDLLDTQRRVGGGSAGVMKPFVSKAAANEASASGQDDIHQARLASQMSGSDGAKQKLRIYRLLKDAQGQSRVVEECIYHPQLVSAYLRIRATKDETFIKVYSQDDEQFKEEKRREKRRMLEEKSRAKRKEESSLKAEKPRTTKEAPSEKPKKLPKAPPPIKENLLRMKCSSCGAFGHMKTNRQCPLYGQDISPKVKTVGEICERPASEVPQMSSMVAIEGTRMKISKKYVEKMKKNALRLHIPRHLLGAKRLKKAKRDGKKQRTRDEQKETEAASTYTAGGAEDSSGTKAAVPSSKMKGGLTLSISIPPAALSSTAQPPPSSVGSSTGLVTPGGTIPMGRRRGTLEEADYLIGPQKTTHRRRADPRVSMATVLHDIFNELKVVENADLLALPNSKKVPDYYEIIKTPMDLKVVSNNISSNKYELRRQFLEDLKHIYVNSVTYNGPIHVISKAAKEVLDIATKKVTDNEGKLIALEKAINPLLDDDDMVGFSHILMEITQNCKNLPKSGAFHVAVDAKKNPFYYRRITHPMDLGAIERNIRKHAYTTVAAFKADVDKIFENSLTFNGPNNPYTLKAKELVELADKQLSENEQSLTELETNIQRAVQGADEGMSMASSDVGGGLLELDPIAAALFSARGREGADDKYKGDVLGMETQLLPDTLNLGAEELASPMPTDDAEGGGPSGTGVAESRGDALHDDLAMSDDEEGAPSDDSEHPEYMGQLAEDSMEQGSMQISGQLHADLAMSSDEEEEERVEVAKRPRMEDADPTLL